MTVRFIVAGVVQGVGFRWFVARRAAGLGLTGYVRNLPDGKVEVVGSGDGAQLEALERAVRTGPRSAVVETVDKTEIPDEPNEFMSFEIK